MRPQELGDAEAGHGRHQEAAVGAFDIVFRIPQIDRQEQDCQDRGERVRAGVGARTDHQSGPLEEVGLVVAQLGQEDRLLLRRAQLCHRREIQEQHEDAGPLDVAEELVAQAPALRRSLDEAGDVGDHHLERLGTGSLGAPAAGT